MADEPQICQANSLCDSDLIAGSFEIISSAGTLQNSISLASDSSSDWSFVTAEADFLSVSSADSDSVPPLDDDGDLSDDSSSVLIGSEFSIDSTASDLLSDLHRTMKFDVLSGLSQNLSLIEISAGKLDLPLSFETLRHPSIWLADTGASSHSTNNMLGATNVVAKGVSSLGPVGRATEFTHTVDIPGQFMTKDGSLGLSTTLTEVGYNAKNNFNLCSLSRLLQNGWHITRGDDTMIAVSDMDGRTIVFDIVIKTQRGAIYATRFARDAEVSVASTDFGAKMSIQRAHALLGHGDEESTRQTAKELGWKLTRGTLKPCEACAVAKAKKKNTVKESKSPKSTVPGEKIYTDISTVTVSRKDGSEFQINQKYWAIRVDEATQKKWSDFTTTKKAFSERSCEWTNQMKARGIPISCFRLDNAGENKKFEQRAQSSDWSHLQPLEFEYTARDTPQHNSYAELAYPYLAGKGRAMMQAANIPDDIRGKVAIEAVKLATYLDGLRVVTVNGVTATRDTHVFGSNPKWSTKLRTFGEAGVVKEGKDAKTGNRGTPMMFVGYPANSESDCYRMWNPSTNRIVETRDIIWMGYMLYSKPADAPLFDLPPTDTESKPHDDAVTDNDVSDDDAEEQNAPSRRVTFADDAIELGSTDDDEIVPEARGTPTNFAASSTIERTELPAAPGMTRSGRTVQRPDRLIESIEPLVDLNQLYSFQGAATELNYLGRLAELDKIEMNLVELSLIQSVFDLNTDDLDDCMDAKWALMLDELQCVGAGVGGGFDHTDELRVMNYKQAMASKDADKWNEEVKNEYERFEKYKVFTPVKRADLEAGAKILTTTWAMKKKTNGKFRGRLNARGYEQLEGTHYFSDSIAAPVSNPITIRTMMTMLASNPRWEPRIIDVEGAFLQGRFRNGEVMYCEVPDGMEPFYGSRHDTVLLMNVPIYGTKQAANCFYETLVKSLKENSYDRSKADPCLYFMWREGRLVIFASWVDDLFACGEPLDLDYFERDLKNAFACKTEEEFNEYVGNLINIDRPDPNGAATIKFTQPVLIQKLAEQWEPTGRVPKTPALAGQSLSKDDGSNALAPVQATKYRSGTAICMYMMQWSRPDIYNATRDLARHMAAPAAQHEKALRHLIHYVTSTPNRGLTLSPDRVWYGGKAFLWKLHCRTDSNYAANIDDRRSVSGTRVFLNGSPISFRSATQRFVTLSVTEAETAAGVTGAQDMMYAYRTLTSLGLEVELPMVLEMDNKGAVDLVNNWSVGGRTRHMDVRMYFLRELKSEGLVVVKHVPGDDNDADIFTKNTASSVFNKHVRKYVGDDEYLEEEQQHNTPS